MKDKNNITIEIGDIVKIENSPIKTDNSTFVVVQDGTSEYYSSKNDLTLYKVAKHKNGYSLSKSKYNINFFPLHNYSNKYKYSREEMNKATVEILIKADKNAYNLVKNEDIEYYNEDTEKTYFRAVIKINDEEIEDVSYGLNERDKMTAFFSNITLKQGETIEIYKQDHSWNYYYKTIKYKLESTKPIEEKKENENTTAEEQEQQETELKNNNIDYEIIESEHTKTQEKLWLVKIKSSLSKEEFAEIKRKFATLKGYYSTFTHSFIFKYNPTETLEEQLQSVA